MLIYNLINIIKIFLKFLLIVNYNSDKNKSFYINLFEKSENRNASRDKVEI